MRGHRLQHISTTHHDNAIILNSEGFRPSSHSCKRDPKIRNTHPRQLSFDPHATIATPITKWLRATPGVNGVPRQGLVYTDV
jgi:hypothetical protein